MVKILVSIIFIGIIILAPQIAWALEIPNPLGSNSTIPALVNTIATWLLEIGLVISTIIVLWAAIQFMTSGGNKEKVTSARQTLWYTIIGITVLLLAKGVTTIVENLLKGNI